MDNDQYYVAAITTVFVYYCLLTLADEVNNTISVPPFTKRIVSMKDQVRLVWEEILGHSGNIACCMGLFLAIRPRLQ